MGMKKRGGDSGDDALRWLDSTADPLAFTTEGWGPVFDGGLQVLTLELVGDLSYLQDGQLNGVLSNNRAIDWAHLIVNVGPSLALPGDFNNDGLVNAADYTVWRDTLDSTTDLRADADRSGVVDQGDNDLWRDNFGQDNGAAAMGVPESTSLGLLLCLLSGAASRGTHRGGTLRDHA